MAVRWNEQRKRWLVDVVWTHADGREERIRKTSPLNTRRGAEEYERQLRGELLARPPAPVATVPTLAGFWPDFLAKYAAVHNRPHEIKMKGIVYRKHLDPAFGLLALDKIGPREVDAFKAGQLAKGFQPKTINNQLTVLSTVLGVASEWEIIPRPRRIKHLKVGPRPFDFLTFEEADRLVAAAKPWIQPMIVVALRTGLRQGELLGLRWQDVELAGKRLVVRRSAVEGNVAPPKNGREREIPLCREAFAAMVEQRAATGRHELVFPSRGTGGLAVAHELWHPLQDTAAAAGLLPRKSGKGTIGWHTLRHTFASHLVMLGANLKAVQELMGHATLEMTLRYAHLAPEAKVTTVALLDDAPRAEPRAAS